MFISAEPRPYFMKPSEIKSTLPASSEKQRNRSIQLSCSNSRNGEQTFQFVVFISPIYISMKLDLILPNPMQ